jgi:hypothetical protein
MDFKYNDSVDFCKHYAEIKMFTSLSHEILHNQDIVSAKFNCFQVCRRFHGIKRAQSSDSIQGKLAQMSYISYRRLEESSIVQCSQAG